MGISFKREEVGEIKKTYGPGSTGSQRKPVAWELEGIRAWNREEWG